MAPKTLRTWPDLTRWKDSDLTAREAELEDETDEEATAESSREFSAIETELDRRAAVRSGDTHAWCNDPRCPEHRYTPTHARWDCPAPQEG